MSAAASAGGHVAKFVLQGGAGDDTIGGSSADDTINGGKGDDVITTVTAGASTGIKSISGDLGDDDITLDTDEASVVTGGDGDDTIDIDTVANDDKGGHSITGGAGADVFERINSTSSSTWNNTSPEIPPVSFTLPHQSSQLG